MKALPPVMIWLYRGALAVYPRRLRLEYREQMLQTLRDAYQDGHTSTPRFWLTMYSDLLQSSLTERMHMVQEHVMKRPVLVHTLALAVLLTLFGGAAALAMQQMLRRGADQPQIDMAGWYAGEITAGVAADEIIPPGYVDMERSLEPFVIFYNEQGRPGPGTGYLDQAWPTLPPGVLDFVRSHGSENVTWQPRPGVRVASVVRCVTGKTTGFVLAGRSLRLVEQQESMLRRMVIGGWITIMAFLAGGASLLNRAQRRRPATA